jgi:hypothetical protein
MGDETPIVVADRRMPQDRRRQNLPVTVERRKQQRRRRIDPTTCEKDYSLEQLEFLRAMERFRRITQFPTCRDVLRVAYSLGYRRVAEATGLPGLCTPTEAGSDAKSP